MGYFSALKKEGTIDTHNMDESPVHSAKLKIKKAKLKNAAHGRIPLTRQTGKHTSSGGGQTSGPRGLGWVRVWL